MRLCVFEDRGVYNLEPLSLTRPAFDLLCGACSLLERQARAFAAEEMGALVRPALADLCRETHPGLPVNDRAWLRAGPTALVNARWLPPAQPVADRETPRVALVGEEVAYIVLPSPGIPEGAAEMVEDCLQSWKDRLPQAAAGGTLVRYPWDLVERNPQALCEDLEWFRAHLQAAPRPGGMGVIGPEDALVVHPDASVEPFVVADTRAGPVLIDRGAVIHSFSRLEGPCYVGPESWIVGANLRGSTLGPKCRVGGEVEASILQGYCNKYHEGFLGHSYLGEWVNIAAGTQVSDLRNDYGPVRLTINGERVNSGLSKVGAFFGDHAKTGIGALLNTGTVAGAFSAMLPEGSLLPQVIPSFCTYGRGQLQESWDLQQLFTTAAIMMRRRGRELTEAYRDRVFTLYEETAGFRRQVIRDSELKRLRRSV
jgi:UDP-N-acetylglucosamine diphosphorylase / glucose-1-phosphate thymidylyltransferase / UDP-N-acetylgalactosamine diphosphorylase / glucosamine-1-phosphate N-acetyltransferase / galactosamine-1-phosphate N-acetyltransferase